MGDFDRNKAPGGEKKNETKKMAAVCMLGVVLLALVGMQFLKKGPQQAVGAPANSGVALPTPVFNGEISKQALTAKLNDLQNDPTAALLKGDVHTDHTLDAVPR